MTWTEITEELLKVDPISGLDGWKKKGELKEKVQQFVRTELQPFKNKVLWVNIVALLIPKYPGDLTNRSLSYKDAVKNALFLPIAIDDTNQQNLDLAYEHINEVELENSEKHLSDYVIKFQETHHKNPFIFQYGNDGKIEIFCNGSSIQSIDGYDYYMNLFKLTSKNSIYFLPHSIYHLPSAKPKLYKTHMVGVYLATSSGTLSTEQCEEFRKDVLNHLVEMFYIKRRRDQDNIFYKEHERLWNESRKKIRMTEVIRKPLAALTQELEKTQENVQVLISVLDSPHRSLFNVAPQVQNYFDDGEPCNFGNVKWVSCHKIDSATTTKELHGVAATLCAIICHVLGAGKKKVNSETELYYLVKLLLKAEDDIYDLRPTLRLILTGKPSVKSEEMNTFFSQLKYMLLQKKIESGNPTIILEGLKRLKYIVHTPFKFSGKTPVIPLVLLFYDYGYRGDISYQFNTANEHIITKSIEKYLSETTSAKKILYDSKSIPVPRYSNILTFISGLLAYMKSQSGKKGIKSILLISIYNEGKEEISKGSVVIEFEKSNFFKLEKIPNLFNLMKTVAENELRCPQGNFRKPFMDFASLVGKNGKFHVSSEDSNFSWIVLKNNWQTVLKISGDRFILKIERKETDGN